MNERIDVLALQALDAKGGLDRHKFAELLVNECANELLKWRREPFPLDAESAARIIKQHFGVN